MKRGLSQWQSLQTRVILLTLAVFLLGIWTLYFYANSILRRDTVRLLGEQQQSALSLLAPSMNNELARRQQALAEIAVMAAPLMGHEAALQAVLDQRLFLPLLFNAGVVIVDARGICIADLPHSNRRVGIDYRGDYWMDAALNQGQAVIGDPVVGIKLRVPVFVMTVPIKDGGGKVVGAVAGVVSLTKENFLDEIGNSRYGSAGEYLLVGARQRTIVMASDRNRILQRLPEPGADLALDRQLDGKAESSSVVRLLGRESLVSSRRVPLSGWLVVAALPAQEAFAPIARMEERMLLVAALLTLAAAVASWWLLRRQLSPLREAAETLSNWSDQAQPVLRLPVARQDEVGAFIGAFNRLLHRLGQREEALRKSETRFSTLIEWSPQPLAVHRGGRLIYANPAALRLFGVSAERAAAGVEIMKRVHPDSREAALERLRMATQQRIAVPMAEVKLLKPDGTVIEVELQSVPIEYDGEPATQIAMRDITASKRAHEALRESERRFSAIFHNSPIGISVSRVADGTILDINEAALRIYGYARERVLGRTVAELNVYVNPSQREVLIGRLREQGQVERFELEVNNSGGSVRKVELTGRAIELRGEPYLVAMMVDVTERKQLEQAHLQAQKLESLGTLTAGIAHDFNNILAGISGNADLAAQDVARDHPAAQSVEEIRQACTRAVELVRRVTAFGRPKEARQEPVDLARIVAEVLKLLRSAVPAGIALKADFVGAVPKVLADAGQVHEAIVNLTTNAAYAIGRRAGAIVYRLERIELTQEEAAAIPGLAPGLYARLTVSDSGCGMDAATMERIFDAFYTTKPHGEGTGLGLSMVHGIMKSHGGAVTVNSAPGAGASFALYFPAASAAQPRGGKGAATRLGKIEGLRALCVDDEEALVSVMQRQLSRLGCHVAGFTDPAAALQAFRARPDTFDIAIVDMSMPQMSGFDLVREMSRIRPHMPTVMASGYVSAEDEAAARALGMELLLKPVALKDLLRALESAARRPHPVSLHVVAGQSDPAR